MTSQPSLLPAALGISLVPNRVHVHGFLAVDALFYVILWKMRISLISKGLFNSKVIE